MIPPNVVLMDIFSVLFSKNESPGTIFYTEKMKLVELSIIELTKIHIIFCSIDSYYGFRLQNNFVSK